MSSRKRQIRHAQKRQHRLIRQAVRARARKQLVKGGKGVAGAATTLADDQRVHRILYVRALRLNGTLQQLLHALRRASGTGNGGYANGSCR